MTQRLDPARLTAAAGALGSLGGFFALAAEPVPDGAAPLAAAYAARPAPGPGRLPGERDPLGRRVERVVSGIGAPEVRVGASIAHLGLCARLLSLHLGSAALLGAPLALDPRRLYWEPEAPAGEELWLTDGQLLPADPEVAARAVVTEHLEPLAEAVGERYGLAAGLLRGNAASALAAARRQVGAAGAVDGPGAERASALAGALLRLPHLQGTGTCTRGGFRRRSCCLYYRVPGGGVCGDCCFTTPPGGDRSSRS